MTSTLKHICTSGFRRLSLRGTLQLTKGVFISLTVLGAPWSACAATPPNYEEHIKPIFREHCLKCHGEDEQKADLNLGSFATVSKGGSGALAACCPRPFLDHLSAWPCP